MDYILKGSDKDVANVIKEQRIRIGRGVITIIPISECGLVTEEDAQKTLEDKLAENDAKGSELIASIAERDAKISELTTSIAEKEKSILELTTERDGMKTRIVGLEAPAIDDNKRLPEDDSKELPTGDSKGLDIAAVDEKIISPAEVKRPGRPKNSN